MTLYNYLAKKFFPIFLASLAFFSFVLILLDLLINIWSYITQAVPVSSILYVSYLYIPKTISFAIPLAILFAASFSLSDLSAKNELFAIFASGISLIRFTLPLLIFSFLASFGFLFFEDRIVVPTYNKKIVTQDVLLQNVESKNNSQVVILLDKGKIVYKADYYDDDAQKLFGLLVVLRNDAMEVEKILRASSASWREDQWLYSEETVFEIINHEVVITKDISGLEIREKPEVFQSNVINIEAENIHDSKLYLEHLEKTGLPMAESLSLYYKKFSFPFIVFVVVFLSIGVSGKTKKNVLLVSLASSLGSAVLFYVTQMLTMLMAKFSVISPLMGAWFPVFLFVGISLVLLRYSKT